MGKMLKFGVLWLLLSILDRVAAERRRNYTKLAISIHPAMGAIANVRIGTPPQPFALLLDTKSAHLAVMDVDCGDPRRRVHCPSYCADGTLVKLYCNPICIPVSAAVRVLSCGFSRRYNSTKSSTFENVGDDVSAAYLDFRPFYGQSAKERIQLATPQYKRAHKWEWWGGFRPKQWLQLEERSALFVRGMLFDFRYFHETGNGVFGLAPQSPDGRLSLIPQMKVAGHLDAAQISVQRKNTIQHSNSFVQGRISLESHYVGMPDAVAESYVSAGLLKRPKNMGSPFLVSADNASLIRMEFSVGNVKIVLDKWKLVNLPKPKELEPNGRPEGATPSPATDFEFTNLVSDGDHRYSDEGQWVFGSALLRFFCFGYDYDLGAVAWAERRAIR